ncbi:5-hydroxytryptamine receptor 4-like [Physella acuta]|uniref:5-hydroxytryptamine receptor 4-like n=1 Tax=Physella acuta TaxID=109671 RepID=UPI0027DD201C|nr:5-hydroxytryptamine receptor 4-like [Physella acuta]
MAALIKSNSSRIFRHAQNDISKTLTISMALTGALTGLFIMPLGIFELIHDGKWILGGLSCNVRMASTSILCAVSVYHITSMAIIRYTAVCKPMYYRLFTNKTGYVMVVFSWIFPASIIIVINATGWWFQGREQVNRCLELAQLCGQMYNTSAILFMFPVCVFIPLALTYPLYVCILRDIWKFNQRKSLFLARRFMDSSETLNTDRNVLSLESSSVAGHVKKDCVLNEQESSKSPEDLNTVFTTSGDGSGNTPSRQRVMERPENHQTSRNLKANLTIGCILVCCTVCWMPSWILAMGALFDIYPWPYWSTVIIIWLAYLNSAINPFLYCFNKVVWNAVRALVCRRLADS